jgi:hypothetical protein
VSPNDDEFEPEDLKGASGSTLTEVCGKILNYDDTNPDPEITDTDRNLMELVLRSSYRNEEGRLVVPALWNPSVIHLLPNNFSIAFNILKSILKKYEKDADKFHQYDDVIAQQRSGGVIQEIGPLSELKSNKYSFLPHNAVFRQNAESTKCRVVLLSNLCDKKGGAMSHNQVSLPGPQLNPKLSAALTLLRFNKYLMIFDLEKAFLQLCLRPDDTDKLLFLWFRDVHSRDYSLVAYKFLRVPFGLRFSPSLLMLALYKILVVDEGNDDVSFRNMFYNLAYMDNIAFSSENVQEMAKAVHVATDIFNSYGFNLQQFATNEKNLHSKLVSSGLAEDVENSKLLGVTWNRAHDAISVKKPSLEVSANTKRAILSSLNSNFDPLGILLPTLNRAKLFFHKIQMDTSLSWDGVLSETLLRTWRKIAKQLNDSVELSIPRSLGDYKSSFDLIAFTDASKDLYGCVVYLFEVSTQKITFLCGKNRVVGSSLASKSIPVLELLSVRFGVSVLFDVFNDFSKAHYPLLIRELQLHTDSMIALSWLHSKAVKLDKIERKGALINNALDAVMHACKLHDVHFHHVTGSSNPADCLTRCVSSRLLYRSKYLTGPDVESLGDVPFVSIPVPSRGQQGSGRVYVSAINSSLSKSIIPFDKISSFAKFCRVTHYINKYLFHLKQGVHRRRPDLFNDLKSECSYEESCCQVLRQAQQTNFPEVFSYFAHKNCPAPIVTQMNLFIDDKGLIRVKGKFQNLNAPFSAKNPILLHKLCPLTKALIMDFHAEMHHAGVYKILAGLRKQFWVPCAFSVVKRALGECLVCKRMYGRTVQINRNSYKHYRINPPEVPFREIALDHIGPFNVHGMDGHNKAYILIITCMWSRAVNLLPSQRIDNETFLRALQCHVFNYGIPQRIISDNGSPIVSSVSQISSFLDDDAVKSYLKEKGVKFLEFTPYPPNASYLGGVVESLVKQVKNLIYSSISKTVLPYDHFQLLVEESKMLINKRPIAFKASLRQKPGFDSDWSVTPEMLVKGYDVPCISIIPHLHCEDSDLGDPSFVAPMDRSLQSELLFQRFERLKNVKERLRQNYWDEFLQNLKEMASSKPGTYEPKLHLKLEINDLVAIRTKFTKPYFYPQGLITKVEKNDLGEIVAVTIRRSNGETIRRHVTDVIFLERGLKPDPQVVEGIVPIRVPRVSIRKAAKLCTMRNANLARNNLA